MNIQSSTFESNFLDLAILGWMKELTPYGMLVTDHELRIQRWNRWMENHSGLKEADLVGKTLFEVFPELISRSLDVNFKNALKGEVTVLSATFHSYLLPFPPTVRESGFDQMQQTARIAPLLHDQETIGTITIVEDVTQREYHNMLLHKQYKNDALLSWALSHLLQSNRPQNLFEEIFPRLASHLRVDAYLCHLLERDGESLKLLSSSGLEVDQERDFARLSIKDELPATRESNFQPKIINRIHESSEPGAERLRKCGFRSYFCCPLLVGEKLIGTLSLASRLQDEFEACEVEFTRTVSQYLAIAIERFLSEEALHEAQRELSLHAEVLEKKVQERTLKLQESLAEIESFSYSLAHDVRAPLRHIQGYSDALKEDFEKELPLAALLYVDSISKAVRRLDKLTQDILKYSKVAREALHLAPVNLNELIRQIIARDPVLNAPGVLSVKGPLHPVLGESSLIEQCLMNLLDNALKFVSNDEPPRIEVYTELLENYQPDDTLRTKGSEFPPFSPVGPFTPDYPKYSHESGSTLSAPKNWVRLWVVDNGIGIAPEYHHKVFGIFERLWNQNQYAGTGIGLAIVAKAVSRMGGSFGVQSEAGNGSKFWIQLPSPKA